MSAVLLCAHVNQVCCLVFQQKLPNESLVHRPKHDLGSTFEGFRMAESRLLRLDFHYVSLGLTRFHYLFHWLAVESCQIV